MSNSELLGLKKTVVDAIEKFRNENERYGYNHLQVRDFFEKLVGAVQAYGTGQEPGAPSMRPVQNITVDKAEMYEKEYGRRADTMIAAINNVRFNQIFRGYDTWQADAMLDEIVKKLSDNKKYSSVNTPIETGWIADRKLNNVFRGYDAGEVDTFLDSLIIEIEKLNDIKEKYR